MEEPDLDSRSEMDPNEGLPAYVRETTAWKIHQGKELKYFTLAHHFILSERKKGKSMHFGIDSLQLGATGSSISGRKRRRTDSDLCRRPFAAIPENEAELLEPLSQSQDVSNLRYFTLFSIFDLNCGHQVTILISNESNLASQLGHTSFSNLRQAVMIHDGSDIPCYAISACISRLPRGRHELLKDLLASQDVVRQIVDGRRRAECHLSLSIDPNSRPMPLSVNILALIEGNDCQLWHQPAILLSWAEQLEKYTEGHTRNVMMANILIELEGDRTSILEAIIDFDLLRIEKLQQESRNAADSNRRLSLRNSELSLVDEIDSYGDFLAWADSIFKDKLRASVNAFVHLNHFILSIKDMNYLVRRFKERLPKSFAAEMGLLKGRKVTPVKERRALLCFFMKNRQRNPHLMPYFATVCTMAMEARGEKGLAAQMLIFLGIRNSKKAIESFRKGIMDDVASIPSILSQERDPQGAIDNHQIIRPRKFCGEKEGKSGTGSWSLKATARFVVKTKKPVIHESYWFPINEGMPAILDIVDPKIPAAPGQLPTELVDFQSEKGQKFLERLVKDLAHASIGPETFRGYTTDENLQFDKEIPFKIGFQRPTDGKRVESHVWLVKILYKMKECKRFLSKKGIKVPKEAQEVADAAHSNRKLMELCGRKAHKELVRQWNSDVHVETLLMLLPVSRYDETSILGLGAVVMEILIDLGLLIHTPERSCLYQLAPNYAERSVNLFGDCLTIDFLVSLMNRMNGARMNGGQMYDLKKVLDEVLKRIKGNPGDWHTSMHYLCVIFFFYYGCWLQPIQAEIAFRNIIKNPSERYERSADFLALVIGEFQREMWLQWALTDGAKGSIATGPFGMVQNYVSWRQDLATKDDEVLRYAISFMNDVEDFQLFNDSCAVGDSHTVENCYHEFLPEFLQSGKNKYKEVCIRTSEAQYTSLRPQPDNAGSSDETDELMEDIGADISMETAMEDLAEGSDEGEIAEEDVAELQLLTQRVNRFVLLNTGKSMITMDGMCEHVNWLLTELPDVKSLEQLIIRSGLLQTYKMCRNWAKAFFTNSRAFNKSTEDADETEPRPESDPFGLKLNAPKSTTKPARTKEKRKIGRFITEAKLCEYVPGRKLDDLDLWALVGTLGDPDIDNLDSGDGTDVDQAAQAETDPDNGRDGSGNDSDDDDDDDGAEDETDGEEDDDDGEEEDNEADVGTAEIDMMECLRQTLADAPTEEQSEDAVDDTATQAPDEVIPLDSDGFVIVANRRMARYKLNRQVIDKPPRETGKAKLRKEDIMAHREERRIENEAMQDLAEARYQVMNERRRKRGDFQIEEREPLDFQKEYDQLVHAFDPLTVAEARRLTEDAPI